MRLLEAGVDAELLLLAPNPWAFGLCTQALSHRDWARLQTVPAEAGLVESVLVDVEEGRVAVTSIATRVVQRAADRVGSCQLSNAV